MKKLVEMTAIAVLAIFILLMAVGGGFIWVLTVGGVTAVVWLWGKSYYCDGDTFDAYKARYPDLVSDGRVKCVKCNGASIWMKQVAYSPFGVKYAHMCRNCGTPLYHSRS